MSSESARYLPMFPLPVFLFPGEEIPLHIFEPRYKQLIHDCRDKKVSFGIPYVRNTMLDRFGSEVRLKSTEKTYHDGSMDITVEAFGLFKLGQFEEIMEGKLYGGALIEELVAPVIPVPGPVRELFLDFVNRFQGEDSSIWTPKVLEKLMGLEIAYRAGFSYDQKLEILSLDRTENQLTYIHRELKLLYKIRELEEQSAGKFHLN